MALINDTDITITHAFVDEIGDPIDLAGFTGFIAKVFQKGIEIDKFSSNVQVGFGLIDLSSPTTDGIITFHVNAEKLRQGIDSLDVFYEIKTEKANAKFENSTEESSTGALLLGTLTKTKLTNETFS